MTQTEPEPEPEPAYELTHNGIRASQSARERGRMWVRYWKGGYNRTKSYRNSQTAADSAEAHDKIELRIITWEEDDE